MRESVIPSLADGQRRCGGAGPSPGTDEDSPAGDVEVRGDSTRLEQADSFPSRVWLCVGLLAVEFRSVQTEQELYSLIYTSFLRLNPEIKTTGLTDSNIPALPK